MSTSGPSDPPSEPAEEALAKALGEAVRVAEALAREPRYQDVGERVAHVLRVMRAAVHAVVRGKAALVDSGEAPDDAPRIEAAEKLVRELAEIALAFARDDMHDPFAKHTRPRAYREALLEFIFSHRKPRDQQGLSMEHFRVLADLVLTGTILYRELEQSRETLARRLRDRLGVNYLRWGWPAEAVDRILRIAGLSPKTVGNLLRGSEQTRRWREKRRREKA